MWGRGSSAGRAVVGGATTVQASSICVKIHTTSTSIPGGRAAPRPAAGVARSQRHRGLLYLPPNATPGPWSQTSSRFSADRALNLDPDGSTCRLRELSSTWFGASAAVFVSFPQQEQRVQKPGTASLAHSSTPYAAIECVLRPRDGRPHRRWRALSGRLCGEPCT